MTTNALIDNPCLSRGLIADFANSRCYKQTSTITTNFAKWWFSGGGWYEDSSLYTNGDKCIKYEPLNGYFYYSIGQKESIAYECRLFNTTYTCNSGWIKLNNSICEYREAF